MHDHQLSAEQPRYVLHPGDVISRHDGHGHYIDSQTLAHLYGVDRAQCVIYADDPNWVELPHDVHLFPRNDGDYRLPEQAERAARKE